MTRRSVIFQLAASALGADPADLDHAAWNSILSKYVDIRHRVRYAKLKEEALPALDAYLARLAEPWPAGISEAARKAASSNAYNALTVRWVLANYPVKSIWRTSHPFTEPRHTVDGNKKSLDAIEKGLRDLGDPRIHAALVCAALSCPPLRREAYVADRLDEQLDDNTREWLSDRNLNTFDPEDRVARVSSIFDWYHGDFEKGKKNSLQSFFERYAPPGLGPSGKQKWRIQFLRYHWGLNDVSDIGADYSNTEFGIDYLKNKL